MLKTKMAIPLFIKNVARYRKVEMVDSLLKAEANVNAENENGDTPLHLATRNGTVEMVDSLLKAGADVNAENENGYTPFDIADSKGFEKIKDLLREKGGDCSFWCRLFN